MSVYKMARELGEMILETKEGKRFYDAKFVYEGDDDAKKALSEYLNFRNLIQSKFHNENLSQDDLKTEIDKLNEIAAKAQKNTVVAELMASEKEFNALVNTVLDILKGTVLKDDSGCSGNCSSCGGCH